MTEQETREKIFNILNNAVPQIYVRGLKDEQGNELIPRIDIEVDALIAAGIGDVGEYKHRAEVAERALQNFAENITCEDCPFFSDCASSEKMEDLIHSNYCFAEYLRQAEKELAEERKDGKMR